MAFTLYGESGFSMNATHRSLDELVVSDGELEFHSMEADVLRFTQETDDATGSGPVSAEEDQLVQLFQDGTRCFKGVVRSVLTESNQITTTVLGPWYWMEKIDLTGDFIDDNGFTGERKNFVFPTQGLGGSVVDLIDRFIALGVPMARGTVDGMFTVMKQSLPNMSCAAALAQLLLWCPDAVVWFDYTNSTPEINVTRRDNMSRMTWTIGSDNLTRKSVRIRPRTDQRVARVVLNYMDRHPTTGKKRFQSQASGATTTGRIQMVTVSGPETVAFLPKDNYESYTIKTVSGIDSSYVAKNDSQLATIRKQFSMMGAVGSQVTTYQASGSTRRASTKTFPGVDIRKGSGSFIPMTGKYLIITADPPDWVIKQYGGVAVTITGTWIAQWKDSERGVDTSWNRGFQAMRAGAITGSGFESEVTVGENSTYKNDWLARPFTVQGYLINTSFPTSSEVYKAWDYDFIAPPAGLAADLRAAQNWTPYEGSAERVADEWPLTNHLNRKLCVANSRPAHATMDSLLRTVRYGLMDGRLQLTLGPPARTDFGSLIDRIRREPSDNIVYL